MTEVRGRLRRRRKKLLDDLKKSEYNVNWMTKHEIAVCGERAVEWLWSCRKTDYRMELS
jgi:hypothetical protein